MKGQDIASISHKKKIDEKHKKDLVLKYYNHVEKKNRKRKRKQI